MPPTPISWQRLPVTVAPRGTCSRAAWRADSRSMIESAVMLAARTGIAATSSRAAGSRAAGSRAASEGRLAILGMGWRSLGWGAMAMRQSSKL